MACIRNLMIVKEAYFSEPHLVISRWVGRDIGNSTRLIC